MGLKISHAENAPHSSGSLRLVAGDWLKMRLSWTPYILPQLPDDESQFISSVCCDPHPTMAPPPLPKTII